ncbi:FixH family protein [Brumimicrobium aurantiacum]|uniref:Nitrogen fixation protein FixH n=1 Tax=Brumimicrobium aurantiacum TaxID=1737063 RepID=A0A3E1EUX5_9FLAO|nr:FixH family protein [Brumimicrobium aurantiacum]RFC53376.1 hypothetical protein DXU93_13160 [Brumimicrobium aurantiacum]
MKFTWGWGIALFLVAFMSYILSMVFKAQEVQTDLYAEDYYEQEINFQHKIDAKTNAIQFNDSVSVENTEAGLMIRLPQIIKNNASAEISLYRPNNANLDLKYVHPKDEFLLINKDKLVAGKYTLSVNWKADNKHFIVDKKITY